MARIFSTAGWGTSGTDIGKFTGQQHGGKSFTHFALHLFGDGAAGGDLLAFAAMQGRAHFAHQAFHSRDREVHIDGKGGAQMFEHLIAFVGLGFEQKLVDDGGVEGLFAQAGGGLLQGLSPLRFLTGGGMQGIGTLRAVG